MTALTDFLLARIAEDIEAATPGEGWTTVGNDHEVPVQFWDYGEVRIGHKRFLAECEAKRRIVEEHSAYEMGGEDYCASCGDVPQIDYPCRTLQFLALPYADHPDLPRGMEAVSEASVFVKNWRKIMHEIETPDWGHDADGECCRHAVLTPRDDEPGPEAS